MSDALIWNALPVPVLHLDGSDRIVQANPAAEQFLNVSLRSLTGTPLSAHVHLPEDVTKAVARTHAGQAPLFVNDTDLQVRARGPVSAALNAAPLSDQPGHLLLLITPREMAGQMQAGQSAQGSVKTAIGMAQMLAHEIKNPLAGITGAAQLLAMSLSGEDHALTDLIVGESRRIVTLLEQVEQFGNLVAPVLRPVNLHDALDRARQSALLGCAGHMQILREYDPSLPPALADGDQLVQVVLNLLRNAAEAAPGGGTIRIRTRFEHAFRLRRQDAPDRTLPLRVEIIDDGPGLPAEIGDAIFDPFVSGRENGTGLGLALVSKIIADHQGWISVSSKPGETVFRLSLPMAPAAPHSDTEETA